MKLRELVLYAGLACAVVLAARPGTLRRAELLLSLPEFVTTPDGMAIAPNGDLVVACPNFAGSPGGKPAPAACFLRIGKDRAARKWFDCPVLAETGRACPMGIAFGPEGDLYIADNQNWAAGNGKNGEINQGRILRVNMRNGEPGEVVVVAKGISHPNGVRYRDGQLYVTVSTMPKVKRPDGLLTSAVYRFPAGARDIEVANTLSDPTLIASFVTRNRFVQYGVDGIVFDSKGRLFVGNFGDGQISRLVFDRAGKVSANTVFAQTDLDMTLDPALPSFLAKATQARMRTTDGIAIDAQDNLFVADFSNNAIARVTPRGKVSVLAQNPDVGGRDGALNEPGEPIVWNGDVVVSNFDAVVGPDKVNQAHESPATLSIIRLR